MTEITWHDFWPPVRLSLQIALLSSFAALVLGVVAARWMSRARFRGKVLVETLFMLPLVLPPTVVGFLLLIVLGRRSWLGRLIEWVFDAPIIFSWYAGVVASVVVAFPLVYQTMKTGFRSINRSLEDAARSIGASEWQLFRYVSLPLVFQSLLSAYILGFARALGEFGATLMIAGNIPGRTQTVPTAIYVAVDSGNMSMAWVWTGTVIVISFLMLLFTGRKAP
ncbi:molybdate ABC transporter permease subunit [Paenibacillus physcomitrellae]|uniref:Molybdenum transport system permease n=1 Tax=Paenibacillus physcomitrellae TaxID=1619311 RepID=A0ABQ1FS59_9BACL|nr:molybdate ABC transporter permease subunit [Paenibacillus physcomitrellae]GGA27281.1 putative molybdenum transport system permease protein YvgM [Paenibacillus physcomitrellae]